MAFLKIGDDGLRLAANMEMRYDAWLQARRKVASGALKWKSSGGKEYLYRVVGRNTSGISLGPRSEATETLMEEYQIARSTVERTWRTLKKDGRVYRALRLPCIASYGAAILRELDVSQLLGSTVIVVDSYALCAYALEAGHLMDSRLTAKKSVVLGWVRDATTDPLPLEASSVLGVLKQIDSTFAINSKKNFQAANSVGNQVELLVAESLVPITARERLRPLPLPEHGWLLPGNWISRIACGLDGLPARIVAPDPRWFAMHRLWLSHDPKHDAHKREWDRELGMSVLSLVDRYMPHFPIDDEFAASLPLDLQPHLHAWTRSGT